MLTGSAHAFLQENTGTPQAATNTVGGTPATACAQAATAAAAAEQRVKIGAGQECSPAAAALPAGGSAEDEEGPAWGAEPQARGGLPALRRPTRLYSLPECLALISEVKRVESIKDSRRLQNLRMTRAEFWREVQRGMSVGSGLKSHRHGCAAQTA